jgi:hypothetical protein
MSETKTWKIDRIFEKGQRETIEQYKEQPVEKNEQMTFSDEERWPKSSHDEGREGRSSKARGKN